MAGKAFLAEFKKIQHMSGFNDKNRRGLALSDAETERVYLIINEMVERMDFLRRWPSLREECKIAAQDKVLFGGGWRDCEGWDDEKVRGAWLWRTVRRMCLDLVRVKGRTFVESREELAEPAAGEERMIGEELLKEMEGVEQWLSESRWGEKGIDVSDEAKENHASNLTNREAGEMVAAALEELRGRYGAAAIVFGIVDYFGNTTENGTESRVWGHRLVAAMPERVKRELEQQGYKVSEAQGSAELREEIRLAIKRLERKEKKKWQEKGDFFGEQTS